MNADQLKIFNLEHAKAGAPVMCRDGVPATVLKWDANNESYPLIGVRHAIEDSAISWTATGRYNDRSVTANDLVMAPLGHIDGKPVFTGDEIIWKPSGARAIVATVDRTFVDCAWPAPARQYPLTGMMMADFDDVLRRAGAKECVALHVAGAIANTALRHAIDAGQVVSAEDVQKALDALANKLKSERYARDMAVAHAVRDWCIREATDAPNLPTFSNIVRGSDLAVVIADMQAGA